MATVATAAPRAPSVGMRARLSARQTGTPESGDPGDHLLPSRCDQEVQQDIVGEDQAECRSEELEQDGRLGVVVSVDPLEERRDGERQEGGRGEAEGRHPADRAADQRADVRARRDHPLGERGEERGEDQSGEEEGAFEEPVCRAVRARRRVAAKPLQQDHVRAEVDRTEAVAMPMGTPREAARASLCPLDVRTHAAARRDVGGSVAASGRLAPSTFPTSAAASRTR